MNATHKFIAFTVLTGIISGSLPLTSLAEEAIPTPEPVQEVSVSPSVIESAPQSGADILLPAATEVPAPLATSTPEVATITEASVPEQAVTPVVPIEEDEDLDLGFDLSEDADAFKDFTGVVRQSTPYNCGPAALATLLTQLGFAATEDEILEIAPTDPEKGIQLSELKRAAVAMGYTAVVRKMTFAELQSYLQKTSDPVLVHDVKKGVGGHYSVIRDISRDSVELSDTEAGNVSMAIADYEKAYDGYVLIVSDAQEADLGGASVSDEEAQTVWGKYVPVYIAAADERGSAQAIANFKSCMARADGLTDYAANRAQRTVCYDIFASELAAKLSGAQDRSVLTETNTDYLQNKHLTDDLISEVPELERQLRALEAKRSDLEAQIRAVPASSKALKNHLSDLRSQLSRIDKQYSRANAQYMNALAYADAKKSTLAKVQKDLSSLTLQLGDLKETIAAKTSSLSKASGSLQKSRDMESQVQNAKRQVEQLQKDVSKLESKEKDLESKLKKLKKNASKNKKEIKSVESDLKKLRKDLSQKESQLKAAKQTLSSLEQEAKRLGSSAADLAALKAAQQQLAQKEVEAKRKEDERARIAREVADAEASLPSYKSELNSVQAQKNQVSQRIAVAENSSKYQNQLRALDAEIAATRNRISEEKSFITQQEVKLQQALNKDLLAEQSAESARIAAEAAASGKEKLTWAVQNPDKLAQGVVDDGLALCTTLGLFAKLNPYVTGGCTVASVGQASASGDSASIIFAGLGGVSGGRVALNAGETVAGLRVTTHASEQYALRNITIDQIENAFKSGVKYLDTNTGNVLHVIGERGKGGYTIVTDSTQKVLVTVEDFVQKLSDARYTLIK
jgi:predicted double-glycine peptidase/predicted  nucleic acid-binding Zn-ribbon protein